MNSIKISLWEPFSSSPRHPLLKTTPEAAAAIDPSDTVIYWQLEFESATSHRAENNDKTAQISQYQIDYHESLTNNMMQARV